MCLDRCWYLYMRIKRIEQTPCTLSLNQTFANAKSEYSAKESILIKIVTDSLSGYGEISPLKKFSTETVQEINWGLQAFIQSIDYNIEYSLEDMLILTEVYCNQIPSLHISDFSQCPFQSIRQRVFKWYNCIDVPKRRCD